MPENKRFNELDSLRGIAALIVIFYHGLIQTVWNNPDDSHNSKQILHRIFEQSPLKIFNSGHQSVIFFFVLSGFVLALPYCNNKAQQYSSFLIKRICRIYIPYLVALGVAIALRVIFSKGEIFGIWSGTIDFKTISNHLIFIGQYSDFAFNPVIWSIIEEMRIAFIFPFIISIVINSNWRNVLLNGFFISCVGIIFHAISPNVDAFTNYYDTIHYIFMFIVGAVLAKNRLIIQDKFIQLSIYKKTALLLFGLWCYTYAFEIANRFGGTPNFQQHTSDWFSTIGASIVIIFALNSKTFSKILLFKPIHFTGKISFGLYLYHFIFFMAFASIIQGSSLVRSYIWILTLIATYIAATISYYYVEKPSIYLGRYLVDKLRLNNKDN